MVNTILNEIKIIVVATYHYEQAAYDLEPVNSRAVLNNVGQCAIEIRL